MELKNTYYYFLETISPEICKKIIDLGTAQIAREKELGHSTEAYTFGNTQKGKMPGAMPQGELAKHELKQQGIDTTNTYVRDSEVTWLEEGWLYELFQPLVHKANKAAGWNWDIDYAESFQFTVYNPSQFYSWHKDGDSDWNGIYKRYIHGVTPVPLQEDGKLPSKYTVNEQMVGKVRKISMTCNLNLPGDYEGGNLKFDWGSHTDGDRYHECEEIRPQGSVILFPGFVSHCVTPVTKGTRYSLVLWSLGKPWK
jgi:PKHD-type hydroxylase